MCVCVCVCVCVCLSVCPISPWWEMQHLLNMMPVTICRQGIYVCCVGNHVMGKLHVEIPLTKTTVQVAHWNPVDEDDGAIRSSYWEPTEVMPFQGQTTRDLCILPDFMYGICLRFAWFDLGNFTWQDGTLCVRWTSQYICVPHLTMDDAKRYPSLPLSYVRTIVCVWLVVSQGVRVRKITCT